MKIVFCSYLRQKWINLRQTKTIVINGAFYTYRQIHLTSGNASFLRYFSHVAAATWPCTRLLVFKLCTTLNESTNDRLDVAGGVRRRRQRQRQLWQFLLEILADDRYSPSIIEWVRRDDGVFRFVKPRSVAELWGKRRRRDHMSYEHLSRAMRYYYRRGVMRRVVDLGRLVYQFLSNAEGWREYTRRG